MRGKPAEPEPAHSSSADTKPKSIKKPTGWNFFFQSVAPEVREQLGRRQVSGRFPSGWQYVKEIADRQTKGWE